MKSYDEFKPETEVNQLYMFEARKNDSKNIIKELKRIFYEVYFIAWILKETVAEGQNLK